MLKTFSAPLQFRLKNISKNRYHPLITLLFRSKMLPSQQINIQKSFKDIKDIYSKVLLGCKSVSQKPNSGFIRELFKETFDKYNLLSQSESINILSDGDGGSENKGAFIEWLNLIKAPLS